MNPSVLIVDDSLTVRKDLEEAFAAAGFAPSSCETIAAARQALAGAPFALVLLDVLLPDGGGLELLRDLKQTPATSQLPVMLLSSEADVGDRVRGLKTGADEYVGKPYDVTYVVARARELIRARAVEPSSVSRTILVIDDSATFREGLRASLEHAGYAVATAASGEEGLRTAVNLRPGAVIVDNVMSGIDGATVIRRMRQDVVLRRTPCLLLTASEDRKNEVKALEAGADAYARKEDDIEIILTRFNAMLRSAAGSSRAVESPSGFLGPKKILAVDDSPTYLHELAAQLKDENYDVALVASGEEALDLLAVQTVDCILLDLFMPTLSGTETCKRIKSTPVWRDIPLLILTARDDRAAMIESINAGADDYIPKSNDFEVLKARLRAQLRRKQFEDENRQIREQLLQKELEAAEARASRELAETRQKLLAELEEKNRRLERAHRLKSEFLANMSHELRTPLNSIIGFSDVLTDGKFGALNERQARFMDNVRQSGRHLLGLINDLLDQSKLEAGRLEVLRQPCAPRVLVDQAVATLQPLADAKTITIACDAKDAPPVPLVWGDAVRFKQVLYNLLSNAIKFTPAGGRVNVSCVATPDSEYVCTSVSDTGPGISQDDQARLFTPFTQLEETSDNRSGGTGLGLSLSKQLVELMGGRIAVESTVGSGATFSFELPVHARAAEEAVPALIERSAAPSRGPARGSAPLALIVDDDPAAQELLGLTLKDGGYRTLMASTGEEALVHARREQPAVITLDVFLPGIDGWDLLRVLRSDSETCEIPVVMVTISNDRNKAFSLGALEHLVKPIAGQALLDALQRRSFTTRAALHRVHVLVVDDDPKQLELIKAELEPKGFVVRTASTGRAGLDAAMLGPVDVVLLDLVLPDLSGVEVVAALRQAERTRALPILLITGQDLSAAERLRLNQGVVAVLTKDAVSSVNLLAEINRVLRTRS